MRQLADAERIRGFMRALGRVAHEDTAAYFTGGATAVLVGWRTTTIDVDVIFSPERDVLLRAIPALKEELAINVELASPAHFIPVPDGWEARSLFVARERKLSFYHFDPYSQALAKLERAHAQDLVDVQALVGAGLVVAEQALELFREIEPNLYRFPSIDPDSFRQRVEEAFASAPRSGR